MLDSRCPSCGNIYKAKELYGGLSECTICSESSSEFEDIVADCKRCNKKLAYSDIKNNKCNNCKSGCYEYRKDYLKPKV